MENGKRFAAKTEFNEKVYKDFFKFYYRQKWKAMRIVTTVVGILALLPAYYFSRTDQLGGAVPCLWLAAFLIIYPRNAYRRPYRRMRSDRSLVRFDFYDDYFVEKSSQKEQKVTYESLHRVYETPKYFYVFSDTSNVNVVLKDGITLGDAAGLRGFLKQRLDKRYKLIVK